MPKNKQQECALQLKNVVKTYGVGENAVKALKGIDLNFRNNEFVSILGPSGCGKTTMLNIIGGLDRYTSGDLIISDKSTKNFKDRDWDVYRNQRIGFIFQSYNLIPHQTVLGNVELALTISGVSKEERVKRALLALERVGLKGEEHKRPNQLSGGQCQRVAIARALVNEPDILLADEPTGALDSKTSVQIMELIKEIAKDKLVIMVTHNADIAEEYSSRIIRLFDGEIVEDTNPLTENDYVQDGTNVTSKKGKKNKAKMSWWTAFKLSARNLLSKRKRTLLTSIAGSIGIIGISAVLAVSSGVRGYINSMQDDMLSGNPITIQEQGYDLDAMMNGMSFGEKKEFIREEGYVNIDSLLTFFADSLNTMDSLLVSNDITQEYVDYVKQIPDEQAVVLLDKGLDVTNNIYTDFSIDGTDATKKNISLSALKNIYTSVMEDTKFKDNASMISTLGDVYMQAPSDEEYILSQYDLNEGGRIAKEKNEIMIVVNGDKALTDLLLAQLGYYSQNEFINIAYKATGDTAYDESMPIKEKIPESELMGRKFVWYPNDTVFSKNTSNSPLEANSPFKYSYKSDDFSSSSKYDERVEFEIVGVLTPKENLNYGCLKAGFFYTEAFSDYVLEKNMNSEIVKYLKDAESTGFSSVVVNGMATTPSVTYTYTYYDIIEKVEKSAVGFVGKANAMSSFMSGMGGMMGGSGTGGSGGNSVSPSYEILELSTRHLGGESISNDIKIYPKNFDMKDLVVEYLDKWNEEKPENEIKYTDTLSLIMAMINSMIDVVTYALISFTSLALVVSCVMISIVTYVSVVERIKEIGVIRSLGGRKKDVSNLFNAETLMIGTTSGLIGIGFTYLLSFIVNIFVKASAGFAIMALQPSSAIIMLLLSVGLTVLSGLIPAKKASRQDPVVALRTE